jgi:hypothetical protein
VNDAADETVPEDGTLDPVDISEEFGDGVGSGLEAGGDPFSGQDFPDVPIEDGGGVGGGSGGSPGNGTEEGEDTKDAQEETFDGPPAGIAVGESLSPEFIAALKVKTDAAAGTPYEFDWNKWTVSRWTVTLTFGAFNYTLNGNPSVSRGTAITATAVNVLATTELDSGYIDGDIGYAAKAFVQRRLDNGSTVTDLYWTSGSDAWAVHPGMGGTPELVWISAATRTA